MKDSILNQELEKVFSAIDAAWERGVADLSSFLSIPSVSGDPAKKGEVARAASFLAELLRRYGFEAAVEPTPGHPVVTAFRQDDPTAPTLLVYGHYDVQPALLDDGWSADPFTPRLLEGALVARGATDDKGQVFCHLLGLGAHIAAHGRLPVNVKFVIEGEEECGSANLENFLTQNRERFACDALVVSDTAQYRAGLPALTYGLRGLLCLEVTVRGANRDLHSGSFGGVAPNPANALAAIVAGLKDEKGRVTAPGFYESVIELDLEERAMWAGLSHDEAALAGELGVDALPGEEGFTGLERMWARPTFDVNGLWSGYQGEGPKTVIPSEAGAKLSFRLVPDQDPQMVANGVLARIRELTPLGVAVEVNVQHWARPVLLPRSGWCVEAAFGAMRAGFGVEPVTIREGGSIPVVETFARLFGAPVVLMGFGRPDDRAHGPDERFHLADLKAGAVSSAVFAALLGKRGENVRPG